jgi:hypothetical protein
VIIVEPGQADLVAVWIELEIPGFIVEHERIKKIMHTMGVSR